MIVLQAPPEHFGFIEQRAGCVLTRYAKALEAIDKGGKVCGMVALDDVTRNSVKLHMAFDHPGALRALLTPGFEYAFQDRDLAVGVIPASNEQSVKLTKHLGFRETYRVRDGWDEGDDLIIFEMRRHECRFLHRRAA